METPARFREAGEKSLKHERALGLWVFTGPIFASRYHESHLEQVPSDCITNRLALCSHPARTAPLPRSQKITPRIDLMRGEFRWR
jgi:hypothetical protein